MTAIEVDTTRLPLLLTELRLPAISRMWPQLTERSDREGWPAARLLAALAEFEIAERGRRRIERHLVEARLPPGKTLDSFEFAAVPMIRYGRGSRPGGGKKCPPQRVASPSTPGRRSRWNTEKGVLQANTFALKGRST